MLIFTSAARRKLIMKIKLLVVFIVALSLLCGACVFYINPPSSESSGSEPNAAQESRAAEAKKYQPSAVSLPDLVPTTILYDVSQLAIGNTVLFDSSIRNVGAADADGFNIKWFVNGIETGYGGHPGIRAGAEDKDSNSLFKWTPDQAGTYKIEFVVDSDGFIEELNEKNNTSSVTVTVSENAGAAQAQQDDGPYIDGLVLQNGIYYYTETNRFDELPGYIAGYVCPSVYVNGKLTGGVCLKPIACMTVLTDALEQIPSGQPKLKVVVPLDIAGFDGKVEIGETALYPSGGGKAHQVLAITCGGSVSVMNTMQHGTLTAWEFKLNTGETLRAVAHVESYENFKSNYAYRNIVICSTGTDLKKYRQGVDTEYENMVYGDVIVQKNRDSVIYLDFVTKDLPCVLTVDDLLTVGGYVVFCNEF
jgi:hypothetical protein